MGQALGIGGPFAISPQTIFQVVGWIAAGVFILFFVLFPTSVFLVCIISKQRVAKMVPLDDAAANSLPRNPAADSASACDYRLLGVFGPGHKCFMTGKAPRGLLLSPDCQTLLITAHERLSKSATIYSRLPNGIWLATSNVAAAMDPTGLLVQQMLSGATFPELFALHKNQLSLSGQAPTTFDPDAVVNDLFEWEQLRVHRLLGAGLARHRSPSLDYWSYTFKGALGVAWGFIESLKAIQKQQRAKHAKAAPGPLNLR